MRDFARATIRHRKGPFVGMFIAVLCAAALVTALGMLFESGLRAGVPPQRYAGAAVLVGAEQSIRCRSSTRPRSPPRPRTRPTPVWSPTSW